MTNARVAIDILEMWRCGDVERRYGTMAKEEHIKIR